MTIPSLSSEEMLKPLQQRIAKIRDYIKMAEGHIARWETFKTQGTIEWAESRIIPSAEVVQGLKAELNAITQAIAILEVLTHPDFANLSNFGRTPELLGAPVMIGFRPGVLNLKPSYATGNTVLEAILKAHEAIKATPKEDTKE